VRLVSFLKHTTLRMRRLLRAPPIGEAASMGLVIHGLERVRYGPVVYVGEQSILIAL